MSETDRDRQKGRRTTSLEEIAKVYEGVGSSHVRKFCLLFRAERKRDKGDERVCVIENEWEEARYILIPYNMVKGVTLT